MNDPIQGDINFKKKLKQNTFLKRIWSIVLGLAAWVEVKLLDVSNSELIEGRTVTLECANNTNNQAWTVWYKNGEVINNATTRNLTLTLKSSDTGLYKCRINGTNSTNGFNVTLKGMIRGVL